MAKRRLKIAIATTGRFHVLDLARELHALGHDVKFYSYVPRRRAEKFGLPRECHVALLPLLAPFIVLVRVFGGTRYSVFADQLLWRAADWAVTMRLRRCDVLIAMSGIYVRSFAHARRKFGAKCILERGSVHIEMQKEILDRIKTLNPEAATVPTSNIKRELQGYQMADRIVVPSFHTRTSFIIRGLPPEKIFRNPYGASLDIFTPVSGIKCDPFLILFVGSWCYRKGVDLLEVAMEQLAGKGFNMVHVGAKGDAPLPRAAWFHSHGAVDQSDLPEWYRRARCLVLPSREEGLSLVQIQAIACGCPVIGSTMSGAVDLAQMLGAGVEVVPVEDTAAIVQAVLRISVNDGDDCLRLDETERKQLDWKAYALRYENMLLESH